jgi:hypothetical protein
MRFSWYFLIYILFPFAAIAQSGSISGVVTSADSKKPLARASVFLSNSSVGTATAENGAFTLSYIRPGQYTLVVTILGYEDYSKTILVGREPIKLNVELTAKPLMLREVVISSAADWKRNYEAFRRDFIGTDENARYCEVENSHILNLTYNQTKQILHADADNFLVIDNKALGYRVKFLVRDFNVDNINNVVSSTGGQRVFEDLPGSASQKRKWHEKREEAYYGSSMHFYRSLYQDKLDQEGFMVYMLKRYANPIRPSEEVIKRKIKIFKEMDRIDSANYYIMLENMSKYVNESLLQPPLQASEICSPAGQPGLYVLHFNNYLYVVYTKKRDEVYYKDIYRPLTMPNYETSVITLINGFPIFDTNGIIVGNDYFYEGSWTKSRLSDMLPVDYVPDEK